MSTLKPTAPTNTISLMDSLEHQLQQSACATEDAYCLPPECYADQAITQIESETLFRNGWIGVGRSSSLANPGDYIARDIAGVATIILRDQQGELRAFANTCRHRGTPLLEGEGNCKAIVCPFHAWSYRLDGSLMGAAHMEHTRDFEREDNGLIAFATAERAGFAFINMSNAPENIDAQLGDFERLHQGWSLDSFIATRSRSLEINCNWKACLDVFNEHYHLKFVHPTSIADLYEIPEPADNTQGAYASQFGKTSGAGSLFPEQQQQKFPDLETIPTELTAGIRYTWVFPNMTFAIAGDALWVYEAYPLGADRCLVQQTVCFPQTTMNLPDFKERAQHYYNRMDDAMEEDIVILEKQHQGFKSPFAQAGRFAVLMEPNVAGFSYWYAKRILNSYK